MNELQIFNNNEFGEVRSLVINDVPWFVGKDICQVFGDKNHNRSISRVADEDKREEEIIDTLGRKQTAIFINESGLYSLLFAMQPQKANNGGVSDAYPIEVSNRIEKLHRFKRWVTSEVLPSIRKHGAYMTDNTLEEALTNPDFGIKLLTKLKEEREARKKAEDKIEADKPKVLFAEAVNASHTSILIGDLAKILRQNGYHTGQNRLFETLRNEGYLMKSGSSKNMPTQKAMELGLFEVKETTINNPDGSIRVTKTTKVTGAGQQYFINLFLAKAS